MYSGCVLCGEFRMLEILITLCSTLLVLPVSGLLTDPGPLCPGDMATLTCNLTGGTVQRWKYNTMVVGDRIFPLNNEVPAVPAVPMVVDGVEFRLSLLSTSGAPYLATQIAFVASERMDGGMLECVNSIPMADESMETVTLQVGGSMPPSSVHLSDPIHGIGQSEVTIEWTPPPNGGNDVMYTIGTTPAPLSGAMSVTTSSTQTTITVRYNTIYTVTVGVTTTCAGVQEATGTISIAGCPRPLPPMDGSIIPFPATNEGAEIVYHCDPGFQPQSNVTAMCASNGLWTPDPAQHQCIAPTVGTMDSTPPSSEASTSRPAATSEGLSTTGDVNSSSFSTSTSPTTATGIIAGVVVVVVALTATAVVVVIIVIIMCSRRSTRKKTASNNGLELQEAPIMEYNTISSRGYEPDIAKSPEKLPFSAEYSLLQTSDPTSGKQENVHGGLVYADIGVSKPKKATPHQSIPAAEDRVVYSAIDTKATAKQKRGPNPDASLDLNMMLIQVRAVIPSWFPFGEALGVPVEVLKEVQKMALEDYDKLVEVLDYWFRAFPKGTQPTWRTVAMALQTVGQEGLSADIMKVYTTGQLPISVSEEVPREAYAGENLPPPPLPPKLEESVGASLPPKPAPRSESLENGPPRPPKANMSQDSAPPRPPKSSLALKPAAPIRPPKPGHV